VNITEWKIDPNVWCLDCVHFPVIFCFHEQVDGTVNFPSFNCFSSLEALQGVHRAREEHRGSELSKSLRRKECVGDRSLNQTKLRRNNTSEVLSRSRNSFPGRGEDRVFEDLENFLSLKRVKAQEEERRRALDRGGKSRGPSDLRKERRL
jgi:hypothetical protein